MKTREQKLLEQNRELEKIADQLEQQRLQKQYNSARSWNWMARLDGVDIVELASEMVDTVEELSGD